MSDIDISSRARTLLAIALRPTDVPDVYVMTTKIYDMICEHLSDPCDPVTTVDSIIGIPFEHFPNEVSMMDRVFELRCSGKKVTVLYE